MPIGFASAVNTMLLAGIAVVLVVPLAWRVRTRRFDPFEPLTLFVLAYGVMFVVRPAAMLVDGRLVHDGPLRTLDVSTTFGQMLLLALLGAVAFVVGYASPVGVWIGRRAEAPRQDHADTRRLVVASLVVGAIGIASLVVSLAMAEGLDTFLEFFRGGATDLGDTIAGGSFYLWFAFLVLVPATVVLFGVAFRSKNRLALALALCLTIITFLRIIPLGNRMFILPLVGGVFVLFHLIRGRRPSVLMLVGLSLVAVLLSAVVSDLRGRAARGENVPETVVRAATPSRLADSITTGPDTEMAPVLAAALEVIPEDLSHRYGRAVFGDLVVRPIPRAIWGEKPLEPRKQLVSRIWPVESARGTINPEFSVLLYFFWDFGLLGVGIGLLAYGISARAGYEYLLSNPGSLRAQVLYSLALWFLVIALRDSPVDSLIRAAFVILPAWLIFKVSTQGRRPELDRRDPAPSGRTV